MLAVLAMKKRWKNRRIAEGKPCDKPNLVMSSAVQVCWEKATRYFEIEEKLVYCTPERYVIDPEETVNLVDENTIGICCILGTTYTGEYEDVKGVNDLLCKKGLHVPIHVDAASGGFVAPFVVPDLEWDFRLENVVSINVSGHKVPSLHFLPSSYPRWLVFVPFADSCSTASCTPVSGGCCGAAPSISRRSSSSTSTTWAPTRRRSRSTSARAPAR
jgi:hypothetical protein